MIAREPTSRSLADAHPRHGHAAVAQRADQQLAQRQQVDALVVRSTSARAPPPPRRTDASRAGRRAWDALAAIAAAEHNGRRCCWSSTSGTRRPTSGPSRASELLEHWRFATVRQSTADELGRRAAATCSSCAATASTTSTPRSSPRPCRSSSPSGRRWPSRYLGHEMLAVGPGTKTGHGDPLRQPARDRRRPARQRRRHPGALRRPRGVRGLRHGHHLRRRLRARATTSAGR